MKKYPKTKSIYLFGEMKFTVCKDIKFDMSFCSAVLSLGFV